MLKRLRNSLIRHEDPYLGANLALSQRMGALLLTLGLIMAVALWPFSPPTEAIGTAGWLASSGLIALGALYVFLLRSQRIQWTYDFLLFSGYAGVALIAME